MFDHVGIHVRDFEAAKAFYSAVLPELGYSCLEDNEAGGGRWLVFASAPDDPFLVIAWSSERTAEPVHLGLVAPSREAVDGFHRCGLAAGGRDNGAPGPRRAHYAYYAAFLLDPDGNNIEAGIRSA